MDNTSSNGINAENSKENSISVQKDNAPVYDKVYMTSLIQRADHSWKDVTNTDEWLRELRGNLID